MLRSPVDTVDFLTDEATWSSVDIAPNGSELVFDLLGDLYILPVTGGRARRITHGPAWDQMPRFSPTGDRIVFSSDRSGSTGLWVVDRDGSRLQGISIPANTTILSPSWLPDGDSILAVSIGHEGGRQRHQILAFPLNGHPPRVIHQGTVAFGAASSRENRSIFYTGPGRTLARLDRERRTVAFLTADQDRCGMRPAVSRDGRLVAFGCEKHDGVWLHVRDLETGAERPVVYLGRIGRVDAALQDYLPGFAFAPSADALIINVQGRLSRVGVATGALTRIPFVAHVQQEVARRIIPQPVALSGDSVTVRLNGVVPSSDGRSAAFSALGEIYYAHTPGSPPQRLTRSGGLKFSPALSPDGRWVAYTTWSDSSLGQVFISATDGSLHRQLTTRADRYANAAWSPDGSRVVFTRGGGAEHRGRNASDDRYFEIWWTPVANPDSRFITTVRNQPGERQLFSTLNVGAGGERVYFLEHEGAQTTLASVRFDGTERRSHARLPHTDQVRLSPDASRIALIHQGEVVVLRANAADTSSRYIDLDAAESKATRMSRQGASSLQWLGDSVLAWGIGDALFKGVVGDSSRREYARIGLPFRSDQETGMIAFINATIVTMGSGGVLRGATLVVRGNRIAAVGSAQAVTVPSEAVVVDAAGTTIIPGLVDTHAHVHMRPLDELRQDKWEYRSYLAHGVTTIFDPQAFSATVFPQAELVSAGLLTGPRVFSSGESLFGAPQYQAAYPDMFAPINTMEDARRVGGRLKSQGALFLKEYLYPRREQREWLAAAAREHGLGITGEGGCSFVRTMTMAIDGYTATEHVVPHRMYGDALEFLARSGIQYTPTLVVGCGTAGAGALLSSRIPFRLEPVFGRIAPQHLLDLPQESYMTEGTDSLIAGWASDARQIVSRGGRVSVGGHGGSHGLSTWWEMKALRSGGMTLDEVLRAATSVGAEKLGLTTQLGSLDRGKLADFVVLDTDSLRDDTGARLILAVSVGGRIHRAPSLTVAWPHSSARRSNRLTTIAAFLQEVSPP